MLDLEAIREYVKWPDDLLSDTARHHLQALIAEVEQLRADLEDKKQIIAERAVEIAERGNEIVDLRAKLKAAEAKVKQWPPAGYEYCRFCGSVYGRRHDRGCPTAGQPG